MKTTKEMIEVMQAYLDGNKIEVVQKNCSEWYPVKEPLWKWDTCDYRVKVNETSVNWDYIDDEYNYLAMDESNDWWAYMDKPVINVPRCVWVDKDPMGCVSRVQEPGYKSPIKDLILPEGIDWKESLICRPGFE